MDSPSHWSSGEIVSPLFLPLHCWWQVLSVQNLDFGMYFSCIMVKQIYHFLSSIWRHKLTILALNITILRSKVQCFRSFVPSGHRFLAPSVWLCPLQSPFKLAGGYPNSQQIVSTHEVQPGSAFKNTCIHKLPRLEIVLFHGSTTEGLWRVSYRTSVSLYSVLDNT